MISVNRNYTPPNSFNTIASTNSLGLVKVGTGLSIDANGVLSVSVPPFTHPTQAGINVATNGLEFISQVTVNTLGHVTSVQKRSIITGNISGTDFDVYGGTGSVIGTGVTLSLRTIVDSGTGSFKKITRNNKGLITGTTNVVWSDLSTLGAIRYTDISENITGLEYNSLTGVFSLTPNYFIPNNTQKTNWDLAFSWGDHSLVGYATETFVNTKFSELIGGAGSAYDTLIEIQNILQSNGSSLSTLLTTLGLKVDKSTTLTINGTTYDLSSNRTWNVGTVTSITTGTGLTGGVITGSGTISLQNLGSNGSYNNVVVDTYGRVVGGSVVNYLTQETDPLFSASPAYGITSTNIGNWNTAYSNNHSAVTLSTSQNGLSLNGQVLSLALATNLLNGAMSSSDKSKLDSLSNYILPVATNSVLGGVKIGSNISIDINGVISVANPYTHPTTDGNLHVPATGTTSLGKILGAGASAGLFGWYTLSELGIQPAGNYLTSLPSHSLSTHSDVTFNTVVSKNVVYHNGTNWVNKTLTLSDISDYSVVNVNYWTKIVNNLSYSSGRVLIGAGTDDVSSLLQVFGDIKLSGVLNGTTGNLTSLVLSSFLQSNEVRVGTRISLGGTYGVVGQVVRSNGTSEYWGTLSHSDIVNFDSRVNTLITSSQSSTNYWTKNNTTQTLSYLDRVLIGTSTDDLSSRLQVNGSIKQSVLSSLLMSNSSGVIVSANQASVISALGFTPYNATNPNGYISSLPSHSIGTHTDVLLGSLVNKHLLIYNSTSSKFENRLLTLSDISDYSLVGLNYWTKTGNTLSYSSGRVLVGSGADDTLNQFQVFGTAKFNSSISGTTGSFTSLTLSTFLQTSEVRVTSRISLGGVYATVGQVVKSNGTTEFWGTLDSTDITNFDSRVNTLITNSISGTNYWTKNNTTQTLSYLNRVLVGTSTDDLSSMLQVNGTIKQSVLSSLLMSNSGGTIIAANQASVISALGFTPYNSTNPNGYISSLPSHSIGLHNDVSLTSPVNKHLIIHNGTSWVNRTLTLADISDYSITGVNYWTKTGLTLSYSSGRVLIGTSVDDTLNQLQVTGSSRFDGNVGIGTTNPIQKQHNNISVGGVGIGLMLSNDSTNATAGRGIGILFAGTGNANIAQIEAQTMTASNNNGGLIFRYSNAGTLTEGIRLADNGFVGINTIPTNPLHIVTSSNDPVRIGQTSATGYSQILFQTNIRTFQIGVGAGSETAVSVANKFFVYDGTAGLVRLAIDSSGRMLLGNVLNGTKLLQINGGIRQTDVISGLVYANAQGEFQTALQSHIATTIGNYYIINGTSLQTANFNISGYATINSIRIWNGTEAASVFIGNAAGNGTNTGLYNTALGCGTLLSLTTGNYNVAMGINALTSNTTGGQNVALGSEALRSNTTGSFNVVLGHSAMYYSTTTSYSIAIGMNAQLNMNRSGNSFNVAVGAFAMNGSSTVASNTGYNNTAVGTYALASIRSGNSNISIGLNSLYALTTGSSNVAIGNGAGSGITAAIYNVLIGHGAGGGAVLTGNWNTYIGGSAGAYTTSGYSNVFIGQGAGSNVTTGYYNIILGVNAGSSIIGGYGNVVIGATNASRIANLNNYIIIADGLGNERFSVDNTGKFLINTTSSYTSSFLQVNGSITQRSIYNSVVYADANGQLITATAQNIRDVLGTASYIQNQYSAPQTGNSWVNGIQRADEYIKSGRKGFYGTYDFTQVQGIWSISENYGISVANNDFGSQYGITYAFDNGTTGVARRPLGGFSHQILFVGNGLVNAAISMDNGKAYFAGNVGIGMATATSGKLHVRDTSNARFWLDNSSANTPYAYFQVNTISTSYLDIQAGDTLAYRNIVLNSLGGNVLIGTTSPTGTWKLQVNSGSSTNDGLYVNGNIRATGNIIADGYFSGTSSDRIYKSEFKEVSVYNVIDNIGVSSYKHKLYDNKRLIGSVAQDIQKYFPELITEDNNGRLRVDNYGYSALALQLGKELKSEVETLKDKIRILENRLGL